MIMCHTIYVYINNDAQQMRPTLFRHSRKYWAQFILKYIIYFNFVNIYSIHDKTDILTHLMDYLQAVSPLSTIQISLEVFLSQC